MKPRQRREKCQKTPHAQNGQPFQLANPDLVHAVDHPEDVQKPGDVHNSERGEDGEGILTEFLEQDLYRDVLPPTPLPPPPQEIVHHTRPALFGHPVTRETLRRKLKELGISSVNKLLRTYTAAELVEAIADFEREAEVGGKVRNPDGFMRWLLR